MQYKSFWSMLLVNAISCHISGPVSHHMQLDVTCCTPHIHGTSLAALDSRPWDAAVGPVKPLKKRRHGTQKKAANN